MKLYRVTSYDYGHPQQIGRGKKCEAVTDRATAIRTYLATRQRLRDRGSRFWIALSHIELPRMDTNLWIRWVETDEINALVLERLRYEYWARDEHTGKVVDMTEPPAFHPAHRA